MQRAMTDSASQLRQDLASFLISRIPGQVGLLIVSGRAIVDPYDAWYLAVDDTLNDRLEATAVPLTWLTKLLRQVSMDNCAAVFDLEVEFLTPPSGGRPRRGPLHAAPLEIERTGGTMVFASLQQATDEAAHRRAANFGELLCEGLTNPEVDRDGDGLLTAEELFGFLRYGLDRLELPEPLIQYRGRGGVVLARCSDGPPVVGVARLARGRERLLARLIDFLLLSFAVALVEAMLFVGYGQIRDAGVTGDLQNVAETGEVVAFQSLYIFYILALAYETTFLGLWSGTVGKLVTGLTVGLGRGRYRRTGALARRVGLILVMFIAYHGVAELIFGLSAITAFVDGAARFVLMVLLITSSGILLMDRNKRTVWDRLSSTQVCRVTELRRPKTRLGSGRSPQGSSADGGLS